MAEKNTSDSELSETASPDPEQIESSIIEMRSERLILDSDLADVYGVTTKRLNQQVKRNAARFGEKYAFQLTNKEFANLRLQSATSSSGHGGRRTPPWAFTEYGVVIDTRSQSTVREEAQTLISESIQHLKDRPKKQGLENEEIAARVVKLLAEAEKEKAIAAKTRAETEKLEFATIVRKLRLLLEVQRAIEHDRVDGFLDVLKEMGDP